jgi:hypothetical protein
MKTNQIIEYWIYSYSGVFEKVFKTKKGAQNYARKHYGCKVESRALTNW